MKNKKVEKLKNKKTEERKFHSTVWPFEIDTLETWAFWDLAFTAEECKKIIDIGNKKGLIKGSTRGNIENIRDSKISWLYPSDNMEWVYRRLTDIILELNKRFFKFDLYGFIEGLQFTHYQAPGGKYGKHVDSGLNMKIRKLSLSIQLSNPNSYEGGDLVLYYGKEEGDIVPKEQGKIIMFPSSTLHEVKPVTKGERYSLVAWITGPQFK
jgi:PKHD-type hydroxylase